MYSIVFQQLNRIKEVQESIQSTCFIQNKNKLISLQQFKEKIFAEFEEKELKFQLEYEPMTPFANEEKEIQYIKELKLVGREVEYKGGIISFDLNKDDNSRNRSFEEEQSDNFFAEVGQFDPSKIKSKPSSFEGDSRENLSSKDENTIPAHPSYSESVIRKATQDLQKIESSQDKELFWEDTEEESDAFEEVFESEGSGIFFEDRMSIREFLRNNPTTNIDEVYNYFSPQEIKKALMKGQIVKRGNKLFI